MKKKQTARCGACGANTDLTDTRDGKTTGLWLNGISHLNRYRLRVTRLVWTDKTQHRNLAQPCTVRSSPPHSHHNTTQQCTARTNTSIRTRQWTSAQNTRTALRKGVVRDICRQISELVICFKANQRVFRFQFLWQRSSNNATLSKRMFLNDIMIPFLVKNTK